MKNTPNINKLIEDYAHAKKWDSRARSNGRRGWNSHAVRASRLGQRIATTAQRNEEAKAAVLAAGLADLYYRYTLDASIFIEQGASA